MSEPDLIIYPAKRRGRPRVAAETDNTPVCVKLPDPLYDRTYARAIQQNISVPEFIRRALAREFRNLK